MKKPLTRSALIKRLEEGIGSDRELDAYLYAIVCNREVVLDPADGKLLGRSRTPPHDECWLEHPNWVSDVLPQYTSSIDAAYQFVEACLPGTGKNTILRATNVAMLSENRTGRPKGCAAALSLIARLMLIGILYQDPPPGCKLDWRQISR